MQKENKRRITWGLLAILLIGILLMGLWWLFIALVVIAGLYQILKRTGAMVWLESKKFLYYPVVFILILLIAISMRLFFIEIYTIPSNSMENTIMTGDKIIAEKLSIGPSLPSSPFEIPWINIVFYLNKNAREKLDKQWWEYKRLQGLRKIKHNDIVIFNHPNKNNETVFIKRCIGLPGDTIVIKNSILTINNRIQQFPENALVKHDAYYNDYSAAKKDIDSLGIRIKHENKKKNSFVLHCSPFRLSEINSLKSIDSVGLKSWKVNTTKSKIFPKAKRTEWTFESFGPLIVPAKGMTIELSEENFSLYAQLIKRNENIEILKKDSAFYAGSKLIDSYTFTRDYYFMMGDNRNDSFDSRGWGVVPINNIIGKTNLVLFSTNSGKFQWQRLLKGIK